MGLTSTLLRILGRRPFVTFGVVTFLMGALLATVNLTSRYALKLYVDDQLRRTPWDAALYQRNSPADSLQSLPRRLSGLETLSQVEARAFLRARFPDNGDVYTEVDGKPLSTPWLSMLAASDLSVLPPQVSLALAAQRPAGAPDAVVPAMGDGAVLALIGPERSMGKAFLALQGAHEFTIRLRNPAGDRVLFETPLRSVVRLDRDELNRWLMDQTGSVTFVPFIGAMLLMPYKPDVITKFDSVANGMVPPEMRAPGYSDHVQRAEYAPEMVYLARFRRDQLISGWDIAGSLRRVKAVNAHMHEVAEMPDVAGRIGPRIVLAHETGDEHEAPASLVFFVDSTTEVLLQRMSGIAQLVGLVTLLVALPLLWMAWMLAANLVGLLMLNERRTLGLMRLRGVPGRALGRTLLIAIVGGGFVGGALGIFSGSVGPLLAYEGGRLPLDVLMQPEQLGLSLLFLAITVVLALLVSRRLVKYAMTISPLEASRRVAASETSHASIRFGALQGIALALGAYVLIRWIFHLSLSARFDTPAIVTIERVLDFLALPLFVYGLVSLIVSRERWMRRGMAPLIRPLGGSLGPIAMRHIAAKPHRTMAFLFIVALMASVSLYPTVTGGSFQDRAVRGAKVQLGTDWQLVYNSPDFVDVSKLQGELNDQFAALSPEIAALVGRLKTIDGVTDAVHMVEAVLPTFYLPGYGLRGVPMFLVGDAEKYVASVYSEPEVGVGKPFADVVSALKSGAVSASPPIAEFWKLTSGTDVMLGMSRGRNSVMAKASGVVAYLPGLPPRSVNDRQGYVQARVDYLNYLFNSNAYLVGSMESRELGTIVALVPRVIVLVKTRPGVTREVMQKALVDATPFAPLEVHNLDDEIGKLGTDMYISLALANIRIYLLGGLLLAVIAIVAVGLANYTEDRRTLALLRIRGASQNQIFRFIVALLLSPALFGLVLGAIASLVAGYGLADYVWQLREIRTVVQLLDTRLVLSPLTLGVAGVIVALLVAVAVGFSSWEFRKTAHESVRA